MTSELLETLFTETGPILDLAEILKSADEPHWRCEWLDGMTVMASYDEESQRLTFMAELGSPVAELDINLARVLLNYNAQTEETGGVRIGLEENTLLLIHDSFASALELPSLCSLLSQFADVARTWYDVIKNYDPTNNSGVLEDLTFGQLEMNAAAIRV